MERTRAVHRRGTAGKLRFREFSAFRVPNLPSSEPALPRRLCTVAHHNKTEQAHMDDLRNHHPKPTAHEREWIATNPIPAMMRLTVMAALALMIGVAGSNLANSTTSNVQVAANHR